MVTHGSLFSGIGGFDLAAEWMGWENVFQVEIDKFCTKVLEKNFPKVKRYGEIKEFDGTKYRGLIDIISGGFPCQPYSLAGKRKGKADDRHLWPEMLRTIREVQPYWVVGENVPGIINWSGGLVFEEVQADLEAEGYKVLPLVLPAVGRGGVHRRRRVWFVAHTVNSGNKSQRNKINKNREERIKIRNNKSFVRSDGYGEDFGNSVSLGRNGGNCLQNINIKKERENKTGWSENGFKPEMGLQCLSRISAKEYDWTLESRMDRIINGIPDQMDRIKSLGNAVVPQVVYQIFKAIEQYESTT